MDFILRQDAIDQMQRLRVHLRTYLHLCFLSPWAAFHNSVAASNIRYHGQRECNRACQFFRMRFGQIVYTISSIQPESNTQLCLHKKLFRIFTGPVPELDGYEEHL